MSCGCNKNMNNLSGGINNPCGEIDLVGGELKQPNPLFKLIQPKIDNIVQYAKDQVDCNIRKIEASEWRDMLIGLNYSKLGKKLEPAPINTIEFAKKEFMPMILATTIGLLVIGAGVGYYVGKKK